MSIGEVSNPNIIDFQGLEEKKKCHILHVSYTLQIQTFSLLFM